MADSQKEAGEEFTCPCCQGMPLAEMMRQMMEVKKSGLPSSCAGMMSRMMEMCGGAGKKDEKHHQEQRETVSNL